MNPFKGPQLIGVSRLLFSHNPRIKDAEGGSHLGQPVLRLALRDPFQSKGCASSRRSPAAIQEPVLSSVSFLPPVTRQLSVSGVSDGLRESQSRKWKHVLQPFCSFSKAQKEAVCSLEARGVPFGSFPSPVTP